MRGWAQFVGWFDGGVELAVGLAQWIGLISLGIVAYLLWQVRTLLLVMFAAIVFAVALDSLARLLMRLFPLLRRQWAIFLAVGTVFTSALVLGLLVIPPIVQQFGEFVTLIPEAVNRIETLIYSAVDRLPTTVELPSLSQLFNTLIETLSPQIADWVSTSVQLFRNTLSAAVGVFLFIILTILLLLDPPAYAESFVSIFPYFYRDRIRFILKRCDASIRGWVLGALINSAFIATLSGLFLWGLGVPLVLANAAIAGVLNFIPNIGPALSVIPPIVVALTDEPWKAGAVVVIYVILQNLESGFLTPYVMSRQVSLLPGFILLAQLLFATFFGFLGLFLALPLAAVLQVWIQEVVIHDVMDRWRKRSEIPRLAERSLLSLPSERVETSAGQTMPQTSDRSSVSSRPLETGDRDRPRPSEAGANAIELAED